jgi:hypothetical protein
MSGWLASLFGIGSEPSKIPRLIRAFGPGDPTLRAYPGRNLEPAIEYSDRPAI